MAAAAAASSSIFFASSTNNTTLQARSFYRRRINLFQRPNLVVVAKTKAKDGDYDGSSSSSSSSSRVGRKDAILRSLRPLSLIFNPKNTTTADDDDDDEPPLSSLSDVFNFYYAKPHCYTISHYYGLLLGNGRDIPTSPDLNFNCWYRDVLMLSQLSFSISDTVFIQDYGFAIIRAIEDFLWDKLQWHDDAYTAQWYDRPSFQMGTTPPDYCWNITDHFTPEGADNEALYLIDVYTKLAWELAALPVIAGRKSTLDTLPNASQTYTIEAMMPDRMPFQAGISHNLGLNFSPDHRIKYSGDNKLIEDVWQTSWGIATNFVGGVIMTHADNLGVMLPPKLAPIQVIIIPFWNKGDEKIGVLNAALSVNECLEAGGIKVKLDDNNQRKHDWKFRFWERKGVPLTIVIGPCDVSHGTVDLWKRRDIKGREDICGKERTVSGISMEPSVLVDCIKEMLDEFQLSLLKRAKKFRDSNIVDVSSYDELKDAISQGKWARGPWSASDEDELKVKEETGATIRCYPFEQPKGDKKCLMTGNAATEVAIFAKSY